MCLPSKSIPTRKNSKSVEHVNSCISFKPNDKDRTTLADYINEQKAAREFLKSLQK